MHYLHYSDDCDINEHQNHLNHHRTSYKLNNCLLILFTVCYVISLSFIIMPYMIIINQFISKFTHIYFWYFHVQFVKQLTLISCTICFNGQPFLHPFSHFLVVNVNKIEPHLLYKIFLQFN